MCSPQSRRVSGLAGGGQSAGIASAVTDTPAELAACLKSDSAKWCKVVRDAGIKVE
jgi:tripartite-type tricarboxylate transporter receptor subunit TctC